MILAIDPGPKESAYVFLKEHNLIPQTFGKCENEDLLCILNKIYKPEHAVIEMVASYGMAVGKEVFETCVWIGRFTELSFCDVKYIYRKDVKLNLCGQTRAKDSNIIQALKDRFGDKGTAKQKGWFYGFKKDIWQAYAVGVTYLDKLKEVTE